VVPLLFAFEPKARIVRAMPVAGIERFDLPGREQHDPLDPERGDEPVHRRQSDPDPCPALNSTDRRLVDTGSQFELSLGESLALSRFTECASDRNPRRHRNLVSPHDPSSSARGGPAIERDNAHRVVISRPMMPATGIGSEMPIARPPIRRPWTAARPDYNPRHAQR
jgi:hypothetical protein